MLHQADAADPFRILLDHNRWANEALTTRCASLTREQFHERFPIGPGSLHDTLTHIQGSTHRWNLLLAGAPSDVRLEAGPARTPDELLALNASIAAELARQAHAHPLSEIVRGVRRGKPYEAPRAAVLSHVLYHSIHHRAQCLNMLRRVGVEDLPDISVLTRALTRSAH